MVLVFFGNELIRIRVTLTIDFQLAASDQSSSQFSGTAKEIFQLLAQIEILLSNYIIAQFFLKEKSQYG
jgi:hypothetical protein